MKKFIFILIFVCLTGSIFAGGLVTNTNQSAMFTRFQCRDATIDVDAAYYNPAGLVHFSDGFFFSVNNLTLGEVDLITSDSDNFDEPQEYKGRVITPIFPAVYAVYKTGRFAFSGGVNLIGGRGSAKYETGLPSFERKIADLIPYMRTNLEPVDQAVTDVSGSDPLYSNITDYELTAEYTIRSFHPGLQLNMAYMINDYFSVATGLRLVRGKNTYRGSLTGINISGTNADGYFKMDPADYLREIANTVGDTLVPSLENALDQVELGTNVVVDAVEVGYGFTPVISIDYAPSLYTNWALKYEFKTRLSLQTEVINGKDGGGRFVDGEEIIADMPAMLSFGLTRRPSNRFMYYAGIHYYFDKPIDFDGSKDEIIDMIDKNSYELAFGAEYKFGNAIRLSAGWLMVRPGVNKEYQSERRYSLPSNTLGGGVGLRLSDLVDLNLGVSYTLYKKGEKEYSYTPENTTSSVDVTEYYDTRTFVFAVGLDFLFGEN
ncbi:MAG: hypothetical protein JW965_01010 [Bacteroidales bacterium]|nr:hypothetical protein [Bacteroidales bacterium]